jgi:hypothetical protein
LAGTVCRVVKLNVVMSLPHERDDDDDGEETDKPVDVMVPDDTGRNVEVIEWGSEKGRPGNVKNYPNSINVIELPELTMAIGSLVGTCDDRVLRGGDHWGYFGFFISCSTTNEVTDSQWRRGSTRSAAFRLNWTAIAERSAKRWRVCHQTARLRTAMTSASQAAKRARVASEQTVRNWCRRYEIGIRLRGVWQVDSIVLEQFLRGRSRVTAP